MIRGKGGRLYQGETNTAQPKAHKIRLPYSDQILLVTRKEMIDFNSKGIIPDRYKKKEKLTVRDILWLAAGLLGGVVFMARMLLLF